MVRSGASSPEEPQGLLDQSGLLSRITPHGLSLVLFPEENPTRTLEIGNVTSRNLGCKPFLDCLSRLLRLYTWVWRIWGRVVGRVETLNKIMNILTGGFSQNGSVTQQAIVQSTLSLLKKVRKIFLLKKYVA